MLRLVFIGKSSMLEWLSGEFEDQTHSPEELLIMIEDALESGLVTAEQIEELLMNYTAGCDMRRR